MFFNEKYIIVRKLKHCIHLIFLFKHFNACDLFTMEANFENNEINEQIQYNPVIVVSNDINTILQSEVSNNILSQQIMSNDNADETTEYYELQPVQCTRKI